MKCITCGDSMSASSYQELKIKGRPHCFCDRGYNIINLQNINILDKSKYSRNQNYWEWLDNYLNFQFSLSELVDRQKRFEALKIKKENKI